MTIYGDGKTTYTDADSLSGDLGKKVREGDKDALQKLKEFAANKNPEQPHSQARALYELAEVYFNGFCEVKKSSAEALKFLIQAAELNDDLASLRLGEIYRDSKQGFKQDGQKALELFLKAADSDNKNGFKLAAEMFREGRGGFKVDGHKAIEIYDDIIRHGEYWAKINRDFKIKSLRLEHYKRALHNAARIYLEGKGGVAPDGYKAIGFFTKLTEADTEVLKEIAEIYLEGKAGVEPDGHKAIEYLNEIIRRNDTKTFIANPSNAMKILADIWREGKAGIPQDGSKAVEYFSKLADNDNSSGLIMCEPDDSLYELGNIFEEGCGDIVPDLQRAIDFYQKSAELGNYSAKIKLKELVGSDNDE